MCKCALTVTISQRENIFDIGFTMVIYRYIVAIVVFYTRIVQSKEVGIALSSGGHEYGASANASFAVRAIDRYGYTVFAVRLTANTFCTQLELNTFTFENFCYPI